MGFRSFLKQKMDKHGGPGGLAAHAVRKAMGQPGPAAAPTSDPAAAAADLADAFAHLPRDPDTDGFVAVAPSNLLKEGEGNTFKAGDVPVACFRVGGKVYAIDDECAHENGPLGEGTINGFVVTCSYHNWRYDVRNGDCLTESDRFISCFRVKEAGGYIWIGPKQREGSKSRGGEHDDGLNVINIHGDDVSKA